MRAIYLLLLTGISAMMANAQNNTAYSVAPAKTTKEFNSTASPAFSSLLNFQSFTQDQYNVTNTETTGNGAEQKENEDMAVIEPVTGSGNMVDRNTGVLTACPAITSFPFTETFETASTTRTCWIVDEFVTGTHSWEYAAGSGGGGSNTTAHGGTLNASFYSGDFEPENITKLVSPPLNLSSLTGTGAQIRFWAVNELWVDDQDILRVYYKTSAGGSWTLLSPDIINVTNWTEYTFTLPSINSDYYIAFESTERWGYGVAIDDITIEAIPTCLSPTAPAIIATGQSTANLSWTAPAIPPSGGYQWKIVLAGQGSGAAAQASGSTGAGVLTAIATGLNPITSYDLYVRSNCGGTDYSAWTFPKTYKLYDDAPGAITLTVGAGCAGADFTNIGATKSNLEVYPSCSGASIAPIWFRFVAPASGVVRVSTDTLAGTFIDSKLGLFSIPTPTDVTDYSKFTIISCDDDGGSALGFGFMGLLYATGLTPGTTYYIAVDKFTASTFNGTFCITVDELKASMLATTKTCGDITDYQKPVGSNNYTGWVPLMDKESKLIAMVQNPAGGEVDEYLVSQNINTAALRSYTGQYYLDRNFRITNDSATNVNVQFFFLNSELAALQAADPIVTLAKLGVTRQIETIPGCHGDFGPANGTNTYLTQTSSGSVNGVSWIRTSTTTLDSSNFYLHTSKAPVRLKAFLQGTYAGGGLHKAVTTTWRDVLRNNATSQPYNTAAFGNYDGGENVPALMFTDNTSTDIVDWVLLELRNADPPAAPIARRAAFIREDGAIVDLDGVSSVSFIGIPSGSYYLTIRHRNHLGIRTATLLGVDGALGRSSVPPLYDFSIAQNQAIQVSTVTTNAAMAQNGSVFLMWAGNANLDAFVRIISQVLPPVPSDAAYILGTILSGNPNGTFSGYSVGDINMDGRVRIISQVLPSIPSDAAFILGTTLNGNPNATRREHK